jgi:tRNA nucleotidyltransferase (CCA-adding enzyme)
MELTIFLTLSELFLKHGFSLWMIGGSTRDHLLKRAFHEFDLVTDATPQEMEQFLPDANFKFAHYGTIKLFINHIKIDITTLREESTYQDLRHPQSIRFVKNLSQDFSRRDFTVNSLYMDKSLHVIDFVNGLEDLKTKTLRMIGDPYARFQEDPLRILRAIRFHHVLQFSLEPTLAKAIIDCFHLIDYLKPQKIQEELLKMGAFEPDKARNMLMSYGIKDIPF